MTRDWKYDAVAIGYPGVVRNNQPVSEPPNLGKGWVDFDYAGALGCRTRIINDAAMQARRLQEDKLLFLGLGACLGSATSRTA